MNVRLPIRTERLLLRRFEDDDWKDMLEWTSDPKVAQYEYWEPYTEEDVKQWIESQKQVKPGDEDEWLELAVVLKVEQKVIGDCAIKVISVENRQGEIGFTLNPRYQRKGFATEAAKAMLCFGFEQLKLHRIIAICDVRNKPSYSLMERLGMRREAHFRQNLFVKGEWRDEFVYAIL